MKTNRILTIAVVLLLVVNVVMLVCMMKGRGHHGMKKQGAKAGPVEMMMKELNMNEQQQTEFKKLKEEHFTTIKPVFDSVRTLKKSLFGLVKEENLNDSLVNNYSGLIAEQQATIDKLTINHFRKVRALFSGDQQKKFDDFVQKMMQRRGPGGMRRDSTGKAH
jgi:Spy/CpxP family protein refolding chaperone